MNGTVSMQRIVQQHEKQVPAFSDTIRSCTSFPQTEMYNHCIAVPILSVFPALIVHSELKSVHPGYPVAFIFKAQVN